MTSTADSPKTARIVLKLTRLILLPATVREARAATVPDVFVGTAPTVRPGFA
jgi:hypothetical protein